MKFFKTAKLNWRVLGSANSENLKVLEGLHKRHLANIANSSQKYTHSIQAMDTRQMNIRLTQDQVVKRMQNMDVTRKVNHNQLMSDLQQAGVNVPRRYAEGIAWALKTKLNGKIPKRRTIPEKPKTTTNDVIERAKKLIPSTNLNEPWKP